MRGLKKILLASVLCAGYAQATWAIGAYPHPILMRQPDGTTLMVRIQGDENFHFVTTTDGFLLQKDKNGYFCYVDYDAKSRKSTLTKQKAHNVADRSAKEVALVKQLTTAKAATADIRDQTHLVRKAPKKLLSPSIVAPKARGTKAADNAEAKESQYLVILVNFQDSVMRHNRDDFDKWLNQPGYNEHGGTGSVKDYYRDNSMGQFVPNFKVVGPYTLSKPTAYYGQNTSDASASDANPREMIKEAVNLAKADNPDLDFKQFDNDGDGVMDNCYVIYAGYSEASTANDDDIWPHSWYLDDDFKVDGVYISDYSCSAELVGRPGYPEEPSMDGIGTFVHEFGHVLGLKDMYDTDNALNGYGINPGDYSLYASGSYLNNSRTPAGLMAFERLQLGWMQEGEDIVEVKTPEDVTLPSVAQNKARFINCQPGRKPGTGMEWFILENRQQIGWDKYIPNHGLLITHYDYTDEMVDEWWYQNGPNNNAQHRCMYIMAADGTDDTTSRKGDTFPGTTGNTSFTDTSNPAAINWANEGVNVPITNIKEENGNVLFQVSGGTSKWNFVKTIAPEDVLDTSATFKASIESHDADVAEVGFCWKEGATAIPTLDDKALNGVSGQLKATDINNPTCAVNGLKPATTYSVASYMKMSNGKVVYGSPIPFTTEYAYTNVTLDEPFYSNFTNWTDGQPEGWEIIDNNGDGSTWEQDQDTNAIVYSYNNWNDADDYLISRRRIHVPEKGTLFFTRGVLESAGIEELEVLISTKTSKKEDFQLIKHYFFADYFNEQHSEEVDLSQFAGKDIYVAFRVCSEKLQNDLWLWDVLVTQKLDTPQDVKLVRTADNELTASWSPVEGADNYYVSLSKETSTLNEQNIFTPKDFYQDVKGDVTLGTGSILFKSSGSVTLKDCPDGITDCIFIASTPEPIGCSELTVEGTEDGETWNALGDKITLGENYSEEQIGDYQAYLMNKHYRQLRFNFKHGGCSVRINYLNIKYNDGKVWEDLSAGAVDIGTSISILDSKDGEFDEGKYRVWVAAGRGNIYYDESAPAYYQASPSSSIKEVIENTSITIEITDGGILIMGLKPGYSVNCTSASGTVLFQGTAQSESLSFNTVGKSGVAIITVNGNGNSYRRKIIIK